MPGPGLWRVLCAIFFYRLRKRVLMAKATSKIKKKNSCLGTFLAVIFFTVFAGIGLAAMFGFVVRPLFKIVASGGWEATPCTIVSSEVVESGGKGGTYRVGVTYTYSYGGQTYTGTRYNFSFGSTSGRQGKADIVAQYPAGTQATCFVNPKQPGEAVISRGIPGDIWFGLIPLVFVVVGVGGIWMVLRSRRPSGARLDALGRPLPAEQERGVRPGMAPGPSREALRDVALARGGGAGGAVPLKASAGPLAKMLGCLFVALFWNGLISFFVVKIFKDFAGGRGEVFPALFMVPFVVIGLCLLGGVVYFFLALFNPKVALELDEDTIPVGGEARLRWKTIGNPGRIASLRIELVGAEKATYRRGTDTHTDTSIFEQLVIYEGTDRREIGLGEATIMIPRLTMHSFDAPNNKIQWAIKVQGSIPKWPDVSSEYPILIVPCAKSAEEAQRERQSRQAGNPSVNEEGEA